MTLQETALLLQGITGRLLMNFQLMQAGFPPINVKFTDRRRYYDCFDSLYRDNNAAPMITMVSDYIEGQLNIMIEAITS